MRILDVINDYDATFYQWDLKGDPQKVVFWHFKCWRYLAILAISMVLGFLGDLKNPNVLSAIISVQAVLIGFSLSALFHIANTIGTDPSSFKEKLDQFDKEGDYERAESIKKVMKMNIELFYILIYFMLFSTSCLILSIICLVPQIFTHDLLKSTLLFKSIPDIAGTWAMSVWKFSNTLPSMFLSFLLVDSIIAFVRLFMGIGSTFKYQLGRLNLD